MADRWFQSSGNFDPLKAIAPSFFKVASFTGIAANFIWTSEKYRYAKSWRESFAVLLQSSYKRGTIFLGHPVVSVSRFGKGVIPLQLMKHLPAVCWQMRDIVRNCRLICEQISPVNLSLNVCFIWIWLMFKVSCATTVMMLFRCYKTMPHKFLCNPFPCHFIVIENDRTITTTTREAP